MKHIAYRHSRSVPLVETLVGGIRRLLPSRLRSPNVQGGRATLRARVVVGVSWLIALAIQAALLLLVAELIEVAHGVMELYLDLAQQQLDLTSLYVSATGPE